MYNEVNLCRIDLSFSGWRLLVEGVYEDMRNYWYWSRLLNKVRDRTCSGTGDPPGTSAVLPGSWPWDSSWRWSPGRPTWGWGSASEEHSRYQSSVGEVLAWDKWSDSSPLSHALPPWLQGSNLTNPTSRFLTEYQMRTALRIPNSLYTLSSPAVGKSSRYSGIDSWIVHSEWRDSDRGSCAKVSSFSLKTLSFTEDLYEWMSVLTAMIVRCHLKLLMIFLLSDAFPARRIWLSDRSGNIPITPRLGILVNSPPDDWSKCFYFISKIPKKNEHRN